MQKMKDGLWSVRQQNERPSLFFSFFFEPRNFTAQCEGPNMDTRGIGLVPCRGICLSLAQEFIIMGK
jgi:hypothetical protein